MSSAARFTVIIVHRNGVEMLMACLASVAQAMGPQDEVIIVDNGSTDDSLDRVRAEFPKTILIENGCNAGFAAAHNRGIAKGQGRYFLLLNNDARLSETALDRLEERFDAYPNAGLMSPVFLDGEGKQQRSAKALPTVLSELGLTRRPRAPKISGDQPVFVPAIVGACMAVRREAVDSAGPMDVDFFFYFEETEWCHRLAAKGWGILVDPSILVTHHTGASTRPYRKGKTIEMFRSRLIYYRKVFGPGMAGLLTVVRVLRLVVNLVANGLLVLLTLGQSKGARTRVLRNWHPLSWMLAGRPDSWGLPDKCPQGGR